MRSGLCALLTAMLLTHAVGLSGAQPSPSCVGDCSGDGAVTVDEGALKVTNCTVFGNLDDNGTCGFTAPGDLASVFDAGDPAFCPITDQRGFGRTGSCDIEAYEANGAPLAP